MKRRPTPEDLIGWEEFTEGQGSYFKTEEEILKPTEPFADCKPRAKEYLIYDPQDIKVESISEEDSIFLQIVNDTQEELTRKRQKILSRVTPYLMLIPEDESQMIELWYKGYSQHEISLMYEISQPTVWAKIDRGLQRLRYLTSLPILPKKAVDAISDILRENEYSEEEIELHKQILICRILTNGHTSVKTQYDISTQKIKRCWSRMKQLLNEEIKKKKRLVVFKKVKQLLALAEKSSVMRTSEKINVFINEKGVAIREVMPVKELDDSHPVKAKRLLRESEIKWRSSRHYNKKPK